MSKFANMLRNLRQQNALTQDELARAIGVTKSAISMYERGNRIPDLTTMEKLAHYFHVDIPTLLGNRPPAAKELNLPNGMKMDDIYELLRKNPRLCTLLYHLKDLKEEDMQLFLAIAEKLSACSTPSSPESFN